MECKFNKRKTLNYNVLTLDGQEIQMSRYLSSIIHNDKKIDNDVNHRTKFFIFKKNYSK